MQKPFFKTLKTNKPFKYGSNLRRNDKMATIKVGVTYGPKKETLSQALASLLTEKPEHTEITAQMSLFDNPPPTETPSPNLHRGTSGVPCGIRIRGP